LLTIYSRHCHPERSIVTHTHTQFIISKFDSIDVAQAQKECAKVPHAPLEVRASAADNALGAQYFIDNKEKLRAQVLEYGAIWFRGFDLMQSVQGHRVMYESLGLDPCLDPLHSSGLRKFASERDALYEEVRRFCLYTSLLVSEEPSVTMSALQSLVCSHLPRLSIFLG
jgi:hypothetical protein